MRDEVEETALPIFAALDACSDDEIERLLLPAIFACVCGRLGDGRAKRTFSNLGADTHTIELRAKELVIDYFFWGQRNKEAFLRKRKGPAGEDYDYRVEDARGASAVRDAVRAARVLNRMSEKQAIEVGIPPHDRAAYIRIDRAKGNYSRIGGETRWLTFDNVDLPQGDSVGVLKLWLMPGAEGATEIGEKADVVFLGILRRFNAEGRRASDRRGMNFAPKLFAREREAKEAKVGVAALEKAMRRLLAEFRIKMVDDGSGGRVVHELQVVE